MDVSSPSSNPWFAALEDVDDPVLLQEFVGDYLVDYPPEEMGSLLDEDDLHYTLSPGSECNSSTAAAEISNSHAGVKRNRNPSSPNSNSNSNSNAAESNQHNQQHFPVQQIDTPPAAAAAANANANADANTLKPTKRPRRLPDQSHNHIIAERQRRQNLSQRFIALSALIPGLKKMDKTSVLGEAITHMKELKERVKRLEDENAKRAVESVVVIQRSRVVAVDNESNSSTSNDESSQMTTGLAHDDQFPEIEVRFSNTSVLIKIHCKMQNGILSKIINRIENLNLIVTNTCSLPFNNSTLDITIMAQMEQDFEMGPQEVADNLRSIF